MISKMNKPDENKFHEGNILRWIPPSFVNGLLYTIAWFILISYGAKGSYFIPIIAAVVCYAVQIILFAKYDNKSLRVCVPLSAIALILGLIQEMIFIHTGMLAYPNGGAFPPIWLLLLYPLFALTLNSSLQFLNKNLLFPFLLGGFGGVLSYLSGERLGGVQLFPPAAYLALFLSWGLFLTILIFFNRKLTRLRD